MRKLCLIVGCAVLLSCPAVFAVEPAGRGGEELTLTIPGPGQLNLVMKMIPAGSFMMGSPATEKRRGDDEGPIHEVVISKPFYMGAYEVTQAQWEAVMGTNPSRTKGADLPVDQVSWLDCQAFIEKLNAMGIGTFRLPTEAESEYACRAGTQTSFYWGDDNEERAVGDYAWYNQNSDRISQPVGRKKPNAWGLYDMSGSIFEWCQDRYADAYSPGKQTDPQGPDSGMYRVLRGGSFDHWPMFLPSANRFRYLPVVRYYCVGFRLVRTRE